MVQKDNHKIMAIGISILLALTLWIYVMEEKNPVQTRTIDNIKVTLKNTDNISKNNLVLFPNQDFTVSISVSGRVRDIVLAKADDFKLEADMGVYLKKGDNDIPVTVDSLPNGIKIEKSEIPKVRIKLDELTTKYVPVNIIVKGKAKEGYEYINSTSEPSGVVVSGAKTYVDEVKKVTGLVNIEGFYKETIKTVALEPLDNNENVITNVSIEPKFADVVVNVQPSKEVPIVVKTTGTLNENLILGDITSKIDSVKIIGKKEDIDKIKAIETESIDLASIKSTVTKEVNLIIPEGISTQSNIKSVGVEINISSKGEKQFKVPITIIGKKDGYEYNIDITTVDVKVSSSQDALVSINDSDIKAEVNVSNIEEGENTLQVNVTTNKKAEVTTVTPDKITVSVEKIR